jgi:hypothetical protein
MLPAQVVRRVSRTAASPLRLADMRRIARDNESPGAHWQPGVRLFPGLRRRRPAQNGIAAPHNGAAQTEKTLVSS